MSEITTFQYLSPRQVSKLIGVSHSTILRLIHKKELDAVVMPPGNYFKLTADEVLAYVTTNRIPLTEAARKVLESQRNHTLTQ